jgi:hypothetical protein
MRQVMNIELRKVKHASFASRETDCFSAEVWINGERAGEVRNDGNGGCNVYTPWTVGQRLEAHAATLPPVRYHGEFLPMSADLLIGRLFDDWLIGKDFDRQAAKGVLFTRAGQRGIRYVQPSHPKKAACVQAWLAPAALEKTRSSLKADIILNTLPRHEALALYKAHTAPEVRP